MSYCIAFLSYISDLCRVFITEKKLDMTTTQHNPNIVHRLSTLGFECQFTPSTWGSTDWFQFTGSGLFRGLTVRAWANGNYVVEDCPPGVDPTMRDHLLDRLLPVANPDELTVGKTVLHSSHSGGGEFVGRVVKATEKAVLIHCFYSGKGRSYSFSFWTPKKFVKADKYVGYTRFSHQFPNWFNTMRFEHYKGYQTDAEVCAAHHTAYEPTNA
jgi:hypothetical protein